MSHGGNATFLLTFRHCHRDSFATNIRPFIEERHDCSLIFVDGTSIPCWYESGELSIRCGLFNEPEVLVEKSL
jgi:hypothetical protein